MRPALLLICLLLAACTQPGKANILHQSGYLLQCASKDCPPMYNELTPEQQQAEATRIKPTTTAPPPPPTPQGQPAYNF
jgi:hypothetical protein